MPLLLKNTKRKNQMIAASGDILSGTTGPGFTPLAKEVEVKNPDLWDNSNEMWALEDEEE